MPVNYEIIPVIVGVTDTGQDLPASIQPMQDGVDPINAAALNRDTENLRNRTEVIRKFLNDHEAIITDNLGLSYCLDGASGVAASIYWDGPYVSGSPNTGINGSGAVWIDQGQDGNPTSTLHIEPINSPAVNTLAGVVCYNAGYSQSNGIALAANWLEMHGSNTIQLVLTYSSVAGSSASAPSLSGGYIVGVPVDIGGSSLLQNIINVTAGPATTWDTVAAALSAAPLVGQSTGLVTVTSGNDPDPSGSFTGTDLVFPNPSVTTSLTFTLSGGFDAERHDILASSLSIIGSSPFNGSTNPLKVGDGLAIMFGNWDYRRTQVVPQAVSFIANASILGSNVYSVSVYPFQTSLPTSGTTVTAASIVNTSQFTNLIEYAIPIAKVALNGELILASGEVLPNPVSGSATSPIGGYDALFTTATNNAYLTGQTLTVPAGTTYEQIQDLAADINGLIAATIGVAQLTDPTSPPVLGNIPPGALQATLTDVYNGVCENALTTFEAVQNIGNYFTQGAVQYTSPTLTCTTPLSAFIQGTYYSVVTPSPLTLTPSSTPAGTIVFHDGTMFLREAASFNPNQDVYIGYWNGTNYYGPGQTGTSGSVCANGWSMGTGQPIKVGDGTGTEMNFSKLDDAFAFLESINKAGIAALSPNQVQELWVYNGAAAFGSTSGATSKVLSNIHIVGKQSSTTENLVEIAISNANYITLSLGNCIVENVSFCVDSVGSSASQFVAASPATDTHWLQVQSSRLVYCTFDGYAAGGTFTTPVAVSEYESNCRTEFVHCTFMNSTDAAVAIKATMGTSLDHSSDACDFATVFDGCSFENVCSSPSSTANGAILVGTALVASAIVDKCHFANIGAYCLSAYTAAGSNSLYFTNCYLEDGVGGAVISTSATSPIVFINNVQLVDAQPETFITPIFQLLSDNSVATISNCNIQLNRQAAAVVATCESIAITNCTLSNTANGATGARNPSLVVLECPANVSNSNISWGAPSGVTWIEANCYLLEVLGGGTFTGNTISSVATQTNGSPTGSIGTAPSPLCYLNSSGLTTFTGNTVYNSQKINLSGSWTLGSNPYAIMSCGVYWHGLGDVSITGNVFQVEAPVWSLVGGSQGSGYGVMAGVFVDTPSASDGTITISSNNFIGTLGGYTITTYPCVDHTGVYLGGNLVTGANNITATISGNQFSLFQNGGILGMWSNEVNNICNIMISGNSFFNTGSEAVVLTYPSPPSAPLFIGTVSSAACYISGVSVVNNSFMNSVGYSYIYIPADKLLTVAAFTGTSSCNFSGNYIDATCTGLVSFFNSRENILVANNVINAGPAITIYSGSGTTHYSQAIIDASTGAITTPYATGTPVVSILFSSDSSLALSGDENISITGNMTASPGFYDDNNITYLTNYVWPILPPSNLATGGPLYLAPNTII